MPRVTASVVDWSSIVYTGHALQRMFERAISTDDVRSVLVADRVIATYPDDRPHPSSLLLGFVAARPLHVVVGYDERTTICYIITVYEPNPLLWEPGFARRRPS